MQNRHVVLQRLLYKCGRQAAASVPAVLGVVRAAQRSASVPALVVEHSDAAGGSHGAALAMRQERLVDHAATGGVLRCSDNDDVSLRQHTRQIVQHALRVKQLPCWVILHSRRT